MRGTKAESPRFYHGRVGVTFIKSAPLGARAPERSRSEAVDAPRLSFRLGLPACLTLLPPDGYAQLVEGLDDALFEDVLRDSGSAGHLDGHIHFGSGVLLLEHLEEI